MKTPSKQFFSARQGLPSIFALSLLTAAVQAQSQAQEQRSGFQLEEVLVTAEKRGARSIMDTSFSISATTGAELELRGITSVVDEIAAAPGASIYSPNASQSQVTIRGIAGALGDATVGYYLDDLPFSAISVPATPNLNPYDLSQLEILRGPQGTLYGASSQGGTVRILTQDPVHNELSGRVNAGFGSVDGDEDSWKLQGVLNVPLIEDVLSARVVVSQVEDGGWIDLPLAGEENHNDSSTETYRAKVLFTPGDRLRITGSVWHSEIDSGDTLSEDDGTANFVYFELDPATFLPAGVRPAPAADQRNGNEFDTYNLKVEYDFDSFSLYSSSSYLDFVQTANSAAFFVPIQQPFFLETFTQEVRLYRSNEMGLSWSAGVFYQEIDQNQQTRVGTVLAGVPDPIETELINRDSASEQLAFFGELSYQLSDEWSVLVGARYFDDERTEEDFEPGTVAGLQAFGIPVKREESFDKLTGRLNVAYTPTDDQLYYLNVAQGFRSGIAQPGLSLLSAVAGGVPAPVWANEEDLISYEVGAKFELMDGRLDVEVAAYYLEWDDIIVGLTALDPNSGLPVAYADNAAEATGMGVDLHLSYRVTEALTVAVSGNVNSTEYGADLALAGIADGDVVQYVPEETFFASLDYRKTIGESGMQGVFYAAYNYTGEIPTYAVGLGQALSDDYGLLSARLGVTTDSWSAFLTGSNLTDENPRTLAFATFPPGNSYRVAPLTYGVEFTLNF